MAQPHLSRKAALAMGALAVYLTPKMALDAKVNLPGMLKDVTAKNWMTSKAKIKKALTSATAGKLAQDADIEDVIELLDTLDNVTDEVADVVAAVPNADDDMSMDTDEATLAKVMAFAKSKGMSDDDCASLSAMLKPAVAADVDAPAPVEKKPEVTKAAMDAAIAAAAKTAEAGAVARLNGVRDAERAVRPYVGEIHVAMDSADAVYKHALEALKVDTVGVHPSAYPAILKVQPVPGAALPRTPRLALDAAASKDYATRFPNASRLAR